MAEKIVMPKLAMSMKQGKVIEWMFAEGQHVDKGQVVLVIETEKVTYEVEAPVSGLLHIVVGLDETVPIHETLALIAQDEDELTQLQAEAPGEAVSPPEPSAAPVATAPEAPAAPEPAAPEPPPAAAPAVAPAEVSVTVSEAVKREGKIKISPLARKLSRQHNLDVALIPGTGPGGRIKKRDVLAFLAQPSAAPAVVQPAAMKAGWAGEVIDGKRVKETIPLDGMRQAMASHMSKSLITSARVSVFMEIDMLHAIALRSRLVAKQEQLGTRISYTDLFIYMAARALKTQPICNATLHEDEIVVWEDVNVGVALSLAKGGMDTSLIVPVIKQADKKSLVEISQELKDLVRKGREGKLSGDDMSGGTFTLTNTAQLLNRWHIQTPMITQPESTILGTSSTIEKPVIVDGEIVVRPMMPISLSFDHRVMDGYQPTQFLSKFASLLEDPDMIWGYMR